MLIKKFIKKKDGFYELLFEDDSKELVYEDLILKYDLLLKKNIDSKLKEKILIENNNFLAYNKALKYISIKMRSVLEVRNYLAKLSIDAENVDITIDKLISQGYLNDVYYSNSYVHDRILLSNDGPYKIMNYLKQNNVSDEIIEDSLSLYTHEIQRDKVSKLINKQVKLNKDKGSYLLKQKILYNLANLGFDRCLIVSELEKFDINDEDLYQNEYNKLYEKLSKKYSGRELEYRIKQKLFQKGFK